MSLLIGFLYLCLHIAVILIVAYAILWIVRDWMGVAIDAMVLKMGKIIVGLLCLIAIVVWLAGVLGYASYRLPLIP